MHKTNTLTKIKSLYPAITSSEKDIADFILNKPEEIYRMTINDLAEKAKVSLPTVFRFAKRLGFQGFKDFKVSLIRDIGVGLHFSPEDFNEDSIEGITASIFEKEIANLKETLANIDYQALEEAVKAIAGAERILVFAVSSSLPVAMDLSWKLSLAGLTSQFNSDIYTQEILAVNSRKSDCAIGISFSGNSVEVVNCLKKAKTNKSKTLCVTTFMNSAITKYADIKLFTSPVKALHQKIDLPAKISQIAILDVLYLLVVLQNKNRAPKSISRAEEALLAHRVSEKR